MSAAPHKMSLCFLMDAPVVEPLAHVTAPPVAPTLPFPGSFSPVTALSKVLPPKRVHRRKLVDASSSSGPKKPRKSRVVYDFPLETLAQHFHLSQRDAAKQLGVSTITIKRNCKRLCIMWPFRANKQQAVYSLRERVGSRSSIGTESEQDDHRDDENDKNDECREGKEGEVEDDMCDPEPADRATAPSRASQRTRTQPEAALQTFTRLSHLRLTELEGERAASNEQRSTCSAGVHRV